MLLRDGPDLFLGIDLGTSSLKAILVSLSGEVAIRCTEAHPTRFPGPGMAEQEPDAWLDALAHALDRIPAPLRERTAAIAVDAHVPSLLAVDGEGRAVLPCLTWQDSRAVAEADLLADRLGDAVPLIGTSLPWDPSQLPAKAAWLAAQPDVVSRTRYLLQPKDLINHALTGSFATDAWSSKGLCHVGTLAPAATVLEAAGWTTEVVPEIRDPWSALDTVSPAAAQRFGLPAGIPVAVGWTDAMTAILAAGGFAAPTGVVLTGTSDIVGASAVTARVPDGLYRVPGSVAPLELAYGPTQSSGAAVNWISTTLGLEVGAALELAAGAQEDRPVFVPYLRGERAPLWNPAVRGAMLGLSDDHGPAELVRAVLDGVALSNRHVLSVAEAAIDEPVREVNVGGRGVGHRAWLDARASALGRPLRLHQEPHLTALGAAMLAALATGAGHGDLEAMRGTVSVYEPTSEQTEQGAERFARYLRASSAALEWSTG